MSALPSSVSPISVRRLINVVDRLGALNAEIAKLNADAADMKKTLKESGYDEIIGKLFRATITTSTKRLLDKKLVSAYLTPDQLAVCMKDSESTSISLSNL